MDDARTLNGVVRYAELSGFDGPGLCVRDHFRKSPQNFGGPRFCLGPLCVLADTTIEPRAGFPRHFHRDMEIVTYVFEGELTHLDDLGHRGTLRPGDAQIMTCGTGLYHAEVNQLADRRTRLYQLWIEPAEPGLTPAYVDVVGTCSNASGFVPLASGRASHEGVARINQDAAVLVAHLAAGESATHLLGPGRRAYLLAARGRIEANGLTIEANSGVALAGVAEIGVCASTPAQALLVDLP